MNLDNSRPGKCHVIPRFKAQIRLEEVKITRQNPLWSNDREKLEERRIFDIWSFNKGNK